MTPELVWAYLAERRAAGHVNLRSGQGLAPLLEHLRCCGLVPRAVPVELDPVELVLTRYARFLASERGLAQSTIRRNVDLVRPFLTGRVRADGDDLRGLSAGDIAAFVTRRMVGRKGTEHGR